MCKKLDYSLKCLIFFGVNLKLECLGAYSSRMRVLVDKLVKPSRAFLSSPPRCSQCFLMASSVNSHSRGLVSCLFGSAALYPVAQKPRDGPINGRATYPVIQRTNNVCSHQSAGMEGAQRPCVLYQCFNGEM